MGLGDYSGEFKVNFGREKNEFLLRLFLLRLFEMTRTITLNKIYVKSTNKINKLNILS